MFGLAGYLDKQKSLLVFVGVILGFFFGWASEILLAFATLRNGPKFGLCFLGCIVCPQLLILADYSILFNFTVLFWTYIAAVTLFYTNSWNYVLISFVVVGIFTLYLITSLFVNIDTILMDLIMNSLQTIFQDTQNNEALSILQERLSSSSKLLLGSGIFTIMVNVLINVVTARVMQGKICNPKGFSHEFFNFNLSSVFPGLIIICQMFVLCNVPYSQSCLLISLFPVLVYGISLVHNVTYGSSVKKIILFLFYLALVIDFHFIMIMMCIFIIIDKYFKLKKTVKL